LPGMGLFHAMRGLPGSSVRPVQSVIGGPDELPGRTLQRSAIDPRTGRGSRCTGRNGCSKTRRRPLSAPRRGNRSSPILQWIDRKRVNRWFPKRRVRRLQCTRPSRRRPQGSPAGRQGCQTMPSRWLLGIGPHRHPFPRTGKFNIRVHGITSKRAIMAWSSCSSTWQWNTYLPA
jgi:hypothetical protein